MAEYDAPQQPQKPTGATSRKTEKGPHGGGTQYNQAKVAKGFMVHSPITGHTQKKNIK